MFKTNTNKVIENTWAHICEHLESEMEEEQTSAEKILLRYFRCVGGATVYHKAYHLVEAGIFDIYYTDVRETLKNILEETDEEANQFDNQQVWELYCHLVAKTIEKKTKNIIKEQKGVILIMNVRIKRNNLENNLEKIDYNRIVESLDKDLQTFYKEIIETTPIDVNFSTIAEVCKNDKKALDITFACICCDLISKYIDAHSVAEEFKKETGTDMDSVSVELMFFILYMLELHTQYEKFLEEQRKYAKEIGKIMDRQAEKSAKLYGISIEYMKHQNIL